MLAASTLAIAKISRRELENFEFDLLARCPSIATHKLVACKHLGQIPIFRQVFHDCGNVAEVQQYQASRATKVKVIDGLVPIRKLPQATKGCGSTRNTYNGWYGSPRCHCEYAVPQPGVAFHANWLRQPFLRKVASDQRTISNFDLILDSSLVA